MEKFIFRYTDRFDRNWTIDCNISKDDIINNGYDIDSINIALSSICDDFIADSLSCYTTNIYLLYGHNHDIYVHDIKYTVLKDENKKHYIDKITASLIVITEEECDRIKRERAEYEKQIFKELEEKEKREREYKEYISQFVSVDFRPKYKYKNNYKYKKVILPNKFKKVRLLKWQNNQGNVKNCYYFGGYTNIRKLTQMFDTLVDNILTEKDIEFIANHSIYGDAYYHAMKNVNKNTNHRKMIEKPKYKDIMIEFRRILNDYIDHGVELDPFIIAVFNVGRKRKYE